MPGGGIMTDRVRARAVITLQFQLLVPLKAFDRRRHCYACPIALVTDVSISIQAKYFPFMLLSFRVDRDEKGNNRSADRLDFIVAMLHSVKPLFLLASNLMGES